MRVRIDWILIVVLIALGGTEVGLRACSNETVAELRKQRRDGYFPPPHVFDSELGYRYLPQHEGVFERTDFTTTLRTNAHGWRDQAFAMKKPDGVWRVAVVGSSYLAANQVQIDEIWLSRVEAELGPVRGRPVELLNFGVDGYRPWNLHGLVTHELADYEPDLVVLWSAVSGLGSRDTSYRAVDVHDTILEARSVSRLNQVLAERNARSLTLPEVLPRYLATTRVLNALLGKEVYSNFRFAGGVSEVQQDPVALLEDMRDQTRARGAGFAWMTFGLRREAEMARLFPDGPPDERVDVPLYVDSELVPDPMSYRFEHDAHWTPEGHADYARRVLPLVRQMVEEQLPAEPGR